MKALTGNFRLATTISLAALLTGCAMPQQGGKQILSTNNIYPAVGPYSQMVEHSGTIYLSGVLPLNLAGNAIQGSTIEEQTKAVLEHIGAKLKSQGLTHNDVLMSTVYMKDLNDFAAMNRVYGEYFRTNPPARATVQVARLPRDVLIEIAVIAKR
jgi:2-iminobutanoate/2-iminopropanoate deaminase